MVVWGCLGVAKRDIGGNAKLTQEERMEAVLDFHGLQARKLFIATTFPAFHHHEIPG